MLKAKDHRIKLRKEGEKFLKTILKLETMYQGNKS
mgnify:CR=1 FL=1